MDSTEYGTGLVWLGQKEYSFAVKAPVGKEEHIFTDARGRREGCMPAEMKLLEPPDSHHLSAAIGWLGLDNWQEANEELEKIAPALRSHPAVLAVKYEVYAKAGGKWDRADEIARELVHTHPEEPQFWIWHAYATRRMPGGGIAQAREILGKAHQLIPQEPLIPYNLGCYECQLGHLQAAWTWLEKAFAVGNAKTFKMMALEDRDWEPLWEKIKEIKKYEL